MTDLTFASPVNRTKRQGYSFNETTGQRIDGRDLWSGRVTIGWKPLDRLQTYLIWEHFSEDDDRIRSSKQLCKKDLGPSNVDGFPVVQNNSIFGTSSYLSQGCLPDIALFQVSGKTPDGSSLRNAERTFQYLVSSRLIESWRDIGTRMSIPISARSNRAICA